MHKITVSWGSAYILLYWWRGLHSKSSCCVDGRKNWNHLKDECVGVECMRKKISTRISVSNLQSHVQNNLFVTWSFSLVFSIFFFPSCLVVLKAIIQLLKRERRRQWREYELKVCQWHTNHDFILTLRASFFHPPTYRNILLLFSFSICFFQCDTFEKWIKKLVQKLQT